jgi:DMSO reductase family type II enzyme heme b subunit
MKAVYLKNASRDDLLNPDSNSWDQAKGVRLDMTPSMLDMQPNDAIKAQWRGKAYGKINAATLDALHNGEILAWRLTWRDEHQDIAIRDNDQFVDAAAILLPSVQNAPLILMGQKGQPVNAWYWRADEGKAGRNIVAEGYGTTKTVDRTSIQCSNRWKNSEWSVVITRPLFVKGDAPLAQLRPGSRTPYGVAIWEGRNQERAGIKSFTLGREDLILESVG